MENFVGEMVIRERNPIGLEAYKSARASPALVSRLRRAQVLVIRLGQQTACTINWTSKLQTFYGLYLSFLISISLVPLSI